MYKFDTKEELVTFLSSEDGDGFEISNSIKQPLISKRDELLSENSSIKQKYATFKDINIEELQTKASRVDTLAQEIETLKKQNNDGSNDEKLEQLKKSMQIELDSKDSKFNEFVSKYQSSQVNGKIAAAISKQKGVVDLLSPAIKNRITSTVNDDGEVEVTIMTNDGKPYFINGEKASLDDLVNEYKSHDLYSRCFDGTGASGSGTRTGGDAKANILDPNSPNYSLTEAMKANAKR